MTPQSLTGIVPKDVKAYGHTKMCMDVHGSMEDPSGQLDLGW